MYSLSQSDTLSFTIRVNCQCSFPAVNHEWPSVSRGASVVHGRPYLMMWARRTIPPPRRRALGSHPPAKLLPKCLPGITVSWLHCYVAGGYFWAITLYAPCRCIFGTNRRVKWRASGASDSYPAPQWLDNETRSTEAGWKLWDESSRKGSNSRAHWDQRSASVVVWPLHFAGPLNNLLVRGREYVNCLERTVHKITYLIMRTQ